MQKLELLWIRKVLLIEYKQENMGAITLILNDKYDAYHKVFNCTIKAFSITDTKMKSMDSYSIFRVIPIPNLINEK